MRFWLVDNIRESVLDALSPADLCNLRLVCHDFSQKIAPKLFRTLRVHFKANTFTKPSRIAALERIGPCARTLEFVLPRTQNTVLPPLINASGEEATFTYQPNASTNAPASSKFGSAEVADLLVKQYPPIFHSATNVSSFVRALNSLPFLSHICIRCPSYEFPCGARSVVDFALISLRVAIERAALTCMDTLSFAPIHPEGLFYMQPLFGAGANPGSMRRWVQIRKMSIDMEASEYDAENGSRRDQLKTLHNYLRNFARTLTSFHFRWQGAKGPSPMSIDTEPGVFAPSSPGARAGGKPPKKTAIRFTALSHVNVENAVVDAAQISAFIDQHRRTLEEFKFESIRLRTGDWDEALSPFTKLQRGGKSKIKHEGTMEVPLMLSPSDGSPATPGKGNTPLDLDFRPERSTPFQKWLSRARTSKAKEQLREGSVHLKHFLRQSLPRR